MLRRTFLKLSLCTLCTPIVPNVQKIVLPEGPKVISLDLLKCISVRAHKNQDLIQHLIQSIKAKGLLRELAVIPMSDGTYYVADGIMRAHAARYLGYTEVPCKIIRREKMLKFDLT